MILERNKKEVEAEEKTSKYFDQRDSPSNVIKDFNPQENKGNKLVSKQILFWGCFLHLMMTFYP